MSKSKNPYKYKVVNEQLNIYQVFGPGIPKNGNNIELCDEQTAKETTVEFYNIYRAGYRAAKKEYLGMEIVS